MLAALGIIVSFMGALLALAAVRFPSRKMMLERWGGGCFVAGLAIVTIHFPMI